LFGVKSQEDLGFEADWAGMLAGGWVTRPEEFLGNEWPMIRLIGIIIGKLAKDVASI